MKQLNIANVYTYPNLVNTIILKKTSLYRTKSFEKVLKVFM